MNDEKNIPEFIEKYIQIAISDIQELGETHDFGEQAIKYLDELIDAMRPDIDGNLKDRYIAVYGAYLGESIRRNYGGKWIKSDVVGWGIQSDGYTAVINVFGKVSKWIDSGSTGDSIFGFYKAIPTLIKHMHKDDDQTNSNEN